MPSVLVVSVDERPTTRLLVELIAEGVRTAGFEVLACSADKCPEDLSSFRLVFLGYQAPILWHQPLSHFVVERKLQLSGREVALFNSYSTGFGRYFFKRLLNKLAGFGIKPQFTLSLRRTGLWAFLGGGVLSEGDLIRAKAFGERTSNTVFGVRIRKESRKSSIAGYQK